jgi:hypothetical protein
VYERDYVTVPVAPDERDQFKSQHDLDAHLAKLDAEMRDGGRQHGLRTRGGAARSHQAAAQPGRDAGAESPPDMAGSALDPVKRGIQEFRSTCA